MGEAVGWWGGHVGLVVVSGGLGWWRVVVVVVVLVRDGWNE